MWSHKPSFRFEIDNFSEQEAKITSQTFVSGGCEWYLTLYPKGETFCDDHLSLFMSVANSKSLGRGWNRSIDYYFVLLTQSDKELYRSAVQKQTEFKEKSPSWGFRKTLPLSKFQEKGFLENDKLIFEVYVQIVEASDVEGGGISEKKDTVDINGFKVLASQANSVRKIFSEHPDLAEDFKLKNQVVRMEYMNVLVNLIVTLHKPSGNHSESELSHARSELCELKEAGFKLDWLQSKLDEVSLQRKKAVVDFHQLDGRVKNLELMKLDFKLDCLKTKLEEASLERKKSYEDDDSRFQTLEERVKKLELMELDYKLDCLKTKLENVSLEKKNTDADWSRVQQLEESVKNLKMMVSHLNVELDKKKGKTSDDGFLLVDDEVA